MSTSKVIEKRDFSTGNIFQKVEGYERETGVKVCGSPFSKRHLSLKLVYALSRKGSCFQKVRVWSKVKDM